MFTSLLLAVAVGTTPAPQEIFIMDDRPTISIPLAGIDLASADNVRRVEQAIHRAALKVCTGTYRDAIYIEMVACTKSAVSDGDAQLGKLIAHNPGSAPVTAAIAISAPSN